MRPPSRCLALPAGTAMQPPPCPSGGGARGPEGPPHSPPPPTQAQEWTEADRRNGGPAPPPKRPLHPGCGSTTAEAGARTPCPLPADGGPAAPRTAQTEQPYQRPARGRRGREPGRGGSPPLPPPPPRRTDPSAADRTAPDARGRPATPMARVYPEGGTPETTAGRPTPDGAGGREGTPPPPGTPLRLGSHRNGPLPPRGRGDAPPQKGSRRGGGGCGWTCSSGDRGRRASPHQHAGATRAPKQYGGRAPDDPPLTTARTGRAEGGFRSAGAPEERSTGRPSPPPTPGRHRDPDRTRTPEGSAPETRGGPGWSIAGRHPEGGQGGAARPPPHPPPPPPWTERRQ